VRYFIALLLICLNCAAAVVTVTSSNAVAIVSTETWLTPSFTAQPASVAVETNGDAAFSVTSTGSLLSYQWRTNGAAVANGGRWSGARTSMLSLTGALIADDGLLIDCVISNACSSPASSAATLTVTNGVGGGGGGGGDGSNGDTKFVTGVTTTTPENDLDYWLGMKVTIPNAGGITITTVGRWCISGNSGDHIVHIYEVGGIELGSATVHLSGATAGQYKYATLSSPIFVNATQIIVVSEETNGGDTWYVDAAVTTTSDATVVQTAFSNDNGTSFSGGTSGSVSHIPVTFQYH
jgi:hypothetical protein